MEENKELFYKEFVKREDGVVRAPYDPEMEFYAMIQAGNIEEVKKLCEQALMDKEGLGILSDNPVNNLRYHFVITTSMVARSCIQAGMDLSVSYSVSDYYIQKADKMKTVQEISDLHPIMCLDYAKRMRNLRKNHICSKPVVQCIDYIYDHLHTRITVEALAEIVDLAPSYLSRLFKKEVGDSLSHYIQIQKIETAKNMLVYSNHSPSEISSILAYPSQSYFTEQFRKITGYTPLKYRDTHFRTTPFSDGN